MATSKAVQKKEPQDALVKFNGRFDDDILRGLTSIEDALRLVQEAYGEITSVEDMDLGSGFKLLGKNKDRLIGVPLLILTTSFHQGEWTEFASALIMTMDGSNARLILNDGGTGIADQLKDMIREKGRPGGFTVPKGLRKSVYPTCPKCDLPLPKGVTVHEPGCGAEMGPEDRHSGTTYYFDISA